MDPFTWNAIHSNVYTFLFHVAILHLRFIKVVLQFVLDISLFTRCFRHWTSASRQLEKSPSSSIFFQRHKYINRSPKKERRLNGDEAFAFTLSLFLFIYLFFSVCVDWLVSSSCRRQTKNVAPLLFIFRQLIPVFQGIVSFRFFSLIRCKTMVHNVETLVCCLWPIGTCDATTFRPGALKEAPLTHLKFPYEALLARWLSILIKQ